MKHTLLFSLSIPVYLSFLLIACNFREEKVPLETAPSTPIAQADLNYTNIKTKVFEPYCISCHSGAGGNSGNINLETYSATLTHIELVEDSVVVKRTMPPSEVLPQEAYALLAAWVESGAPEQ